MIRHTGRTVVAVVLLAIVFAVGVSADVDTRFEEIAQGWFASHNSGDAEVMRAFIAKYRTAAALAERPVDARVQRRMGMFGQIGAIEPREVVRHTDSTIVYKAFGPKVGMWVECGFAFEVGDEVKLAEMSIRPTAAPAGAEGAIEWDTVAELIEKIVADNDIPALAAAVVEGDEIIDVAVAGVRAHGGDDAVTPGDFWHIGSVTKSVTATMIAALVQSDALAWDLTVGEALSDIDMRDEYRDVTLADLLHHMGGIQPYTNVTAADEARLSALTGTHTEIRAGFAAEVLELEPVGPRGAFSYSNAGYTLAALMAERAAGASWAELVSERVFVPAGLEGSGFGWPATPERSDQPRGHFLEGDTLRVQGLEEYALGEYIAPAGDVYMAIEDMARYARFHLRGLAGGAGGLSAESFAWLHTAGDPEARQKYAAGWVIDDDDTMGETHWHNGSAGTFYSHVALYPERGRAVVIVTNGSLMRGQAAAISVLTLLNERAK